MALTFTFIFGSFTSKYNHVDTIIIIKSKALCSVLDSYDSQVAVIFMKEFFSQPVFVADQWNFMRKIIFWYKNIAVSGKQ